MDRPDSPHPDTTQFRHGQRVHAAGDTWRIGTVRYLGPVEGYSGIWVGVDWDNGEGKHDGSINGFRYFSAKSEKSGSFVRVQNLSAGISLMEALVLRYRVESAKEDEDEMYVLSESNKRVSIQLVGKDRIQEKLSHFEELRGASLCCLGVSSSGGSSPISDMIPNMKELDMTANLLSDWRDVATICKALPALSVLNLSYNAMAYDIIDLPPLHNIRVLVLNNTGIQWIQVDMLNQSFPALEELHLMGNNISTITSTSPKIVQGFDNLRILNLGDNCIAEWVEISKLSNLRSLEQLHLNKNKLNCIFYPSVNMSSDDCLRASQKNNNRPFQNLRCLLLGDNKIQEVSSIDSLNCFPELIDVRLSGNQVADTGKGGIPRFVLIARLAKVEILNGSEVRPRERKESEIRYVRQIMSTLHDIEEIKKLHPRFLELKQFHGIEDESPKVGAAGPQNLSSGLVSLNLRCVGASIGERPLLTKKLPATTTVGKLKILCDCFFKLGPVKLKLYLQEEGSPLPVLLDEDLSSLTDAGISNGGTILVDVES